MTTNSQLSTTEPRKQKLSKQVEQEQNHTKGYERGGGNMGRKVQGIRSINGRYKIDRGRLRIV